MVKTFTATCNSNDHESGKKLIREAFAIYTPDTYNFGASPDLTNNRLSFPHVYQTMPKRILKTASIWLLSLATLLSFAVSSQAQDVDLALHKTVSNPMPALGEQLTFTLYLVNKDTVAATGIRVLTKTPLGAINNISFNADSGSPTYNTSNGEITWNILQIAAGDSLKLEITANALARGVFYSISEVIASDQNDPNSVPGNQNLAEDDMAVSCFSVPVFWYPGDEYTVTIPAVFNPGSGIIWYKDGNPVTGSTVGAYVTGDSLVIQSPGVYSFTTNTSTCSASGCCPVIMEEGPYGAIGDFVWEDSNKDGIQNTGEDGIANVKVYLLDNNRIVLDSTSTNSTGYYLFDSLQNGNYIIRFLTPDDFKFTASRVTGNAVNSDADSLGFSQVISINVLDANGNPRSLSDIARINTTVDAGLVSSLKFDLALSKTMTAAGPFLPGQTITFDLEITNEGQIDATDVNLIDRIPEGLILFDNDWFLTNGSSAILRNTVNVPAGRSLLIPITFRISNSYAGSSITNSAEIYQAYGPLDEPVTDDDSTPNNNINTEDDQDSETILIQSGSTGGIIGDFVWNDMNRNGIQDLNEPGISGVSVTLERPNGTFLADTITSANGYYSFTNLAAGNYVVVFSKPSNYTASPVNQTVATNDSNADPFTGKSQIITLANNEINLTIDAGFYLTDSCETISLIAASDPSICLNDSSYLTATSTGGSDINWYYSSAGGSPVFFSLSGDPVIVSPTTTTTYYAQISTLQPGCQPQRYPVTVIVNAVPPAPTVNGPAEVCIGQTLNLNDYIISNPYTTGGTHEWRTGASPTSSLVANPAQATAGDYYLFEISSNGCYSNPARLRVLEKSCQELIDLSIIKIANKRRVETGDLVTYTITLNNEGPNIATNVIINDRLPAGLSFVSANGLTYTNGLIAAHLNSVGVNETRTFTYTARVTATSGFIINVVEVVSADQTDVDSTPGNAATENEDDDDDEIIELINKTPVADLSLIKLVSDDRPNKGDIINYTISVTNSGSNNATNVEVQDILPKGLIFLGATGGSNNTFSNNTVTATWNTIAVGQTVLLNIRVVADSVGRFVNLAQVTKSDQNDPDSTPGNAPGVNEDDNDSVEIHVQDSCNPLTPIIVAQNTSICRGGSTQLTATGCNGMVYWSTGETGTTIVVSPLVNTSYNAHCLVSGCISPTSNTVNIAVLNTTPPVISAGNTVLCTGGSTILTASGCAGTVQWSDGKMGNSITVTPQVTTTYTATCTIGTCSSAASNAVTIQVVTNVPAPVITANSNSVCAGSSATLTASGCSGTVQWSDGRTGNSITVTPQGTTTYTATCTVGTCSSNASNAVTIQVITNMPAPVITANLNSVCAGSSAVLTSTGCTGTVQWSDGRTGNSITVTPQATTTYTATCTIGTCSSNASNAVTIQVITNVSAPVITASSNSVCAGSGATLTANGCSGTVQWSDGRTGNSITVTPQTTTAYTATCTIGTCTSLNSNILSIVVNTSVVPPVITASSNVLCQGTSAILSATGCTGIIQWSDGRVGNSITVTPQATTTYTATCTVGSCTSAASNGLQIRITPGGEIPVITASSSSICSGDLVVLTASNCTQSLIWNTGATTPQIQVRPTSSEVYSVTCGAGTCAGTAIVEIEVITATPVTITANRNNICSGESVLLTASGCTQNIVWSNGSTNQSITVSPSFTQPYTVTCGTGVCKTSNSFTVVVGSGNPINITASKSAICPGESVTLTATGCNEAVTWNTGQTGNSITVSPTVTTTYSAVCGSGSCANTGSVTLNVNTTPVSVIASNASICAGQSVTLTASGCTQGLLWSNGATASVITVNPASTQTYSVTCGSGSCQTSASATVTVNTAPTPVVNALLANTCPVKFVNLSNAIIGTPATPGGVFVFRLGNTPASQAVSRPDSVTSSRTFYIFERTSSGCYSSPAQVQTVINDCIEPNATDVSILLTANKNQALLNDLVTYSIIVRNNGPVTATNVTIRNEIPAALALQGIPNGLTRNGDTLSAVIPTLQVNQSVTFTYTVRVNENREITSVARVTRLDQTDTYLPNNISSFTLQCGNCSDICIATSLKADTIRQTNGSYNIRFTALLQNCGNQNLTRISLRANLSAMFGSIPEYTIVQQPTANSGSSLIPDPAYNGNTITELLRPASTLQAADTDTLTWIINVRPNSNFGPYSINTVITGYSTDLAYSSTDISNDGLIIERPLSTPTVIRLAPAPSIGLALAIIDTVYLNNNSIDVTYQAIVKNNGLIDLQNVIVSDSLFITFFNPASYSVTGSPQIRSGSTLIPNTGFNGLSDVNLTTSTSTLAAGITDTIRFTVNVIPATVRVFSNQAIARGTGGNETVSDISNDGFDPDIAGNNPTILYLKDDPFSCLGVALYVADSVKLENGSYDITYHALLYNCGNVNLTNVSLCDSLTPDFPYPSVVVLKSAPTTGTGSLLRINNNYDGHANHCMLDAANSVLQPNKIDTVKWTINLALNGFDGPFRKNVTVNAQTPSGGTISDISNDGMNPAPEGETPTVLNFNNLPPDLIGIAKELLAIEAIDSTTYDVSFRFVLRNYGILDFTGVQLQDNLAETFGNKVSIDSVRIFDAGTGFTVNPAYTGKGDLINMLVSDMSTLPRGRSESISLKIRVDLVNADTLVYENMALAIGFRNGTSTDDLSTDGINPDPDFDGNPLNNSLPTVIDFRGIVPVNKTPLGIAKAVTDTTRQTDGSYEVMYTFVVKNFGDTLLTNIVIEDSLSTVFANNTSWSILSGPTVSGNSTLMSNSGFNGRTNLNMLVSENSRLAAGISDTITLKLKIRNNAAETQTYLNSAYGSALYRNIRVTDKSESGLNPDSDNDNNPGNNNEATPLTLEPEESFVMIPGGISPNGDDRNDVLLIKGITPSDSLQLYIYNRWGELVFFSENYKNDYPGTSDGWDGTANTGIRFKQGNSKLPDGTYFFRAESTNPKLFNGKPYFNFITIAGSGTN
jgi:uncharacterized repeat protein (TIGR01451 family)/gliding motility-associated-like protein